MRGWYEQDYFNVWSAKLSKLVGLKRHEAFARRRSDRFEFFRVSRAHHPL